MCAPDVPIEGSDAPAPGGNNNPGSGSGGGGGNGGGGQTDGNPDASMEGGDGSHQAPSQANDGSSGGGGQGGGGGGGGPAAASDSDHHPMMGVEHSDASAANAYLALAPHMIPSITPHDKTTALPPSVMMPYSPQLPTAHTQPYSPPMRPGLPSAALWGRLGSGPLAYTPTPPPPATNTTVVPQSKPGYFPSNADGPPPAMVAPTPTQSIPQQPQQHGGPGGIAGVTVGVGMAGMVQPVPHHTPHQHQQHAAFAAAAGGAAGPPPHGGHGPLGSLLTFFSPQARNA